MNPFQMLQMMKNGSSPLAMARQMAGNNPKMNELLDNLQNKNSKELEQYAKNLAQSKGIDLRQFLGQFGLNI